MIQGFRNALKAAKEDERVAKDAKKSFERLIALMSDEKETHKLTDVANAPFIMRMLDAAIVADSFYNGLDTVTKKLIKVDLLEFDDWEARQRESQLLQEKLSKEVEAYLYGGLLHSKRKDYKKPLSHFQIKEFNELMLDIEKMLDQDDPKKYLESLKLKYKE